MEKPSQQPIEKENLSSNPTIAEISFAIASLFDGYDLASEELVSSIEDIYALINTICTQLPSDLRTQLLLWPNKESEIHYFVEDLRQKYPYDKNSIINNALDSYLKFFDRWGEWALANWRKIVRTYNPKRISDLKKTRN